MQNETQKPSVESDLLKAFETELANLAEMGEETAANMKELSEGLGRLKNEFVDLREGLEQCTEEVRVVKEKQREVLRRLAREKGTWDLEREKNN